MTMAAAIPPELYAKINRLEAAMKELRRAESPSNAHYFNIRNWGAKGDATYIDSIVSTTNGSATVTVPGWNFAPGDEGKIFCVRGAINTIIVNSTIASVVSSTTIILNATANATTTTGSAVYGTDNTSAIQAAINAAAGWGTWKNAPYRWKGSTVLIPGLQFLSRKVTIKNHVTIEGLDEGSTLVMAPASADTALIDNDIHACFPKVRYLRIDGRNDFQTQTAGSGPHGIAWDWSGAPNYTLDEEGDPYPEVTHVTLYNINGIGGKFTGRGEGQFAHWKGRNIAGDGLVVCFDSQVSDCSFGVIGGAGFNLGNNALGGSLRVSNCKAFHCGNPLLAANTESWSTARNGGAGFFLYNSRGVEMSSCEAQDCAGDGFHLDTITDSSMNDCHADSNSAALQGDAGFGLANCQRVRIDGNASDRGPTERTGEGGTHYAQRYAVRLWFSCSNNVIHVSEGNYSGLANYAPVYPESNPNSNGGIGNTIVVGNQLGVQNFTYAASYATTGFTPNPYLGGTVNITLTGNIIVNNVATPNRHTGVELTLNLAQDATGGRTITWGALYKVGGFTWSTAANAINSLTFKWNGSLWVRVASQVM